jgi:hypothetical protein
MSSPKWSIEGTGEIGKLLGSQAQGPRVGKFTLRGIKEIVWEFILHLYECLGGLLLAEYSICRSLF